MANGVNTVTVGGNLGQDPEIRVTQGGTSVMTLSLACNESYLDNNRQRQERTEWIKCIVWGKRAEGLARFLKKGSWILVEGSLRTSSWEDRDGIKRWKTEVVAKSVYFGGSNTQRGNQRRGNKQERDPQERRPNRRQEEDDYDSTPAQSGGGDGYDDGGEWNKPGDDDIPFACCTYGARELWWRW